VDGEIADGKVEFHGAFLFFLGDGRKSLSRTDGRIHFTSVLPEIERASRWRKTGNFDCENGSKAAAVRNPASLAHAAVSGAGYAVGGTEIFTDGRSSIF
jgi:hypothetical protein